MLINCFNYIICCDFRGDYTEAIQLQYDPNTVSYLELLKLFWDHHDPTAKFKKQVCTYHFVISFYIFLIHIKRALLLNVLLLSKVENDHGCMMFVLGGI